MTSKLYQTALHLFRRDLRLTDNTALNAALASAQQVIVGFVFDPRQIEPHPYQSQYALPFMRQALDDLAGQCRVAGTELAFFQGLPTQVIRRLQHQAGIEAVFVNRDYSPFSRKRDAEIAEVCLELGLKLHTLPDTLLTEPEQVRKTDGEVYQVFTAFYRNASKIPVPTPKPLFSGEFLTLEADGMPNWPPSHPPVCPGGRQAGLALLGRLGECADYAVQRNFPALAATSQLSPHLKFGTISIREAFHMVTETLGAEHPLLRQLYWRDFFTHIAFHFPQVFGHAFIEKFDTIAWDNNRSYFQAWAEGQTGFPIVDAGMRELNATGCMPNRVRMIVASFLVKDLRISWRWGERYFAQRLVDYDPSINNGNWQWAASTGCDAQPYFRIFNPWLQQRKFDPNGDYLYRWLPELREVPINVLHHWDSQHYGDFYPAPIINHAVESQITKERFRLT